MKSDERDMDFMQNSFVILTKDGKIYNRTLDLIVFGQMNNSNHSATAITVGTPAAIGAQMILDGEIKERGVMTPDKEYVGQRILFNLENMGIKVTEEKTLKTKF